MNTNTLHGIISPGKDGVFAYRASLCLWCDTIIAVCIIPTSIVLTFFFLLFLREHCDLEVDRVYTLPSP